MSGLKRLIQEIHRRSLWQVLAIYLVGAWIGFEVIQTLTEGLGLPGWFPALALVLFIILLPVVLATAFVQEGGPVTRAPDPTLLPSGGAGPDSARVRRLLTWRNASFAVAVVFGLWGVAATGWLLLAEGRGPMSGDTAAVAGSEPRKSVAVLPFDNLSPEPEADEYFAEGVHDEILAHLSKIHDLKVISRTSVMRFKGAELGLPEIAAELGVATILEGTVRRAEGKVRITAQLIDARTDDRLWAETYERDYAGIFAIQTEVAQAIAAALEANLEPETRQRMQKKPTESLAAYDLYLRGRYFWNRRSAEDFYRAIEHFQRAIDEDPRYAPAYAGLADTYNLLAAYWMMRPAEAVPMARAAAESALAIDPNLAQAHSSLAFIHIWYDWEWSEAEAGFKRALSLDPNYALAHQYYSMYLVSQSQPDEALAEARRAVELDPLSVFSRNHLARYLVLTRRYGEAVEALRTAAEMDPEIGNPYGWLFRIYALQGRHDEAVEALEISRRVSGASAAELAALERTYADSGWEGLLAAEAKRLTERYEAEWVAGEGRGTRLLGGDEGSPTLLAQLYAFLGQKDDAFEWLDVAYRERRIGLHALRFNPFWDNLRSDPRFAELVNKIGLK